MTTADAVAAEVRSADGTALAYERSGAGPALILVDAASGYREFGPMRPLAELLAADFTVYTYDRRGRGESSDTPPYAIEREVEDLAALISEAGGSACLYGMSSGGLLALQAAAAGLDLPRLALFEPPLSTDPDASRAFTAEMAALVEAGRNRGAVEHFQRSIGVPEEMLANMEAIMPVLEAIAPTLVYDCRISAETSLELIGHVEQPTLVIDSHGSSDDLNEWTALVVEALPHGTHRSLAGEWHGVADDVLAPVLAEFLRL